jgi:hypothetical protein
MCAVSRLASQKIDEVGAAHAYEEMIARYEKVPFMREQSAYQGVWRNGEILWSTQPARPSS